MEGFRQGRRGNEGGGKEAQRGAGTAEGSLMVDSCLGIQGPSKPRKTARSAEEKWVRRREVAPPAKIGVQPTPRRSDAGNCGARLVPVRGHQVSTHPAPVRRGERADR